MSQDMEFERLRLLVTAASEPSPCPSSQRLAQAAAGELDADERDVIADHLASCATCSEDYRVAAALGPWARQTVENSAAAPASNRAAGQQHTRWLALAASTLLAIGLSAILALWALSLREENERLAAALRTDDLAAHTAEDVRASDRATIADLQARLAAALAPDLNAPIVDLLPRDALRGDTAAETPRVPAGSRQVTFVITTAQRPDARDHEMEIVDATGAVRWRGAGLRPNADRVFTATVPRALLPAGMCHVRLYVTRENTPRLVADYPVVVE